MNHEDYREWIVLQHYGELDPFQEERLEEHLSGCESCRGHGQELELVLGMVDGARIEPPATLLEEARRELGDLIREDSLESSSFQNRSGYWAVAAALLLGVAVGFLLFGLRQPQSLPLDLQSSYGIRNFRIQEAIASNGTIEVLMDLVQPLRLQGEPGDPRIQEALTGVLRTSPNPGERIRATLALESAGEGAWNEAVRAALIHSLKSDPNIGVRRRVLGLLQESAHQPDVQRALVEVLLSDANPGLRVAAITALARVVDRTPQLDAELAERLYQRVQHEKNDFIRLQSKAYLQEVRFQ